jgi:hypothetical protein
MRAPMPTREATMKKRRGTSKRDPQATPDDLVEAMQSPHFKLRPERLLAPPPPIVETIFFSKVGHTFKKVLQPFGPPLYVVQDFLLDQTGTSGADGKMGGLKSFDLTTALSYRVTVRPKDRRRRIKVLPPPTGPVFFGMDVGRRYVNAGSDYMDQYVSNSFFIGLNGPAPAFSYNAFSIGHNTNHWIKFMLMADVHAAIDFNAFTTFGYYPPRSFDPGLKSYIPFSNSLPVNLPGPNSVPYLMFSHLTPDSVDPGPCVWLT